MAEADDDGHTRVETLNRRLQMLGMIPRYPGSITAAQLTERLHRAGIRVARRTVERDLKGFADSQFMPLGCDHQSGRALHWFWPGDTPRTEFPAMSRPTALSLLMVEQHLEHLLPPALREQLSSYFDSARAALQREDPEDRAAATWPDKVRVVPMGQPLLAPHIPEGVLEGVYEALLYERRFEARYRPRSEDGAERDYLVNPLALVVRNHLIYLIATLWDYDDVKHLPLHRFSQVKLLDEAGRKPAGFDLDAYLYQSRAFDIPDPEGRTIRLVARFDAGAAYHLYETPLSPDQTLEPDGEGRVRLTATVLDTEQLWWWLRGFGDAVEILEPEG